MLGGWLTSPCCRRAAWWEKSRSNAGSGLRPLDFFIGQSQCASDDELSEVMTASEQPADEQSVEPARLDRSGVHYVTGGGRSRMRCNE